MHAETINNAEEPAEAEDAVISNSQSYPRPPIARKVLGALFVIASIFPILLAVASYCGRYSHLAELISNFRLQIVLMLGCACLVVLMFGYRRWAGVLLVMALAIGLGFAREYLPGTNPPAGSRTIKLMSFNVYESNKNYSATIDCIQAEDADVVFVIEYELNWLRELKKLDATYPYQILQPRWHGFGIAVFSKLPLSDTQIYQLTENATDNPFIVTHINVGNQHLRLAAAHLLAPMDQLRMNVRNQQLAEIATHLRDSVQPTVLAGDFNCVPWSPFMKDMLKTTRLRDSRVGFGYQASWPTDWIPMRIPIDQALVSNSIHVSKRRVLGATGSDHFPLVLEFSISE